MKGEMDKSLFFITLSAVCVWLIVDMAVGKDRLGAFLGTLFPFMNGSTSVEPLTQEEVESKTENAPDSAAISGGKKAEEKKYSVPGTTGPLDSIPYGTTRPGVN